MNNLLLIGLLIAPSIYCGENPRARCYVAMQLGRTVGALNSQIANMNNLGYVENLEAAIYKELSKTGGCEIPADVTIGNFQIAGDLHKNFPNPLLVQPGSTVMACVQSICMKDARTVTTYIVDIPVVAPIHGKPGSQCPPNRTHGPLPGLCQLVENDPVKVDPVGNGRRGYARKGINIDIPMDGVNVKWQLPKTYNPFG